MIKGFEHDGVVEYRGIPFAKPPVGDLRFEPPLDVTAWRKPLRADHWRSACPQSARFHQTDESLDEDCLYLNIALNNSTEKNRPVMVWFYGGAYVGGSANLYRLDWLASHTNAIIVAGNYRVGALGFLSHPDLNPATSSSVGLLDQRKTLDWVKRNISRLGGDPNNITIAGESAGAVSVCLHLASPMNDEHTFAKAIVQSGACLNPLPTQSQLNANGLDFAVRLGCRAHDLACAKRQPIRKILAVQSEMTSQNPYSFIPGVGSAFLPQAPSERFRSGNFVTVPVLNGGNQDEYTLYVGYQVASGQVIDDTHFHSAAEAVYGDHTDAILTEYATDKDYLSLTPQQRLGRLESDYMPPGVLSQCLMLSTAAVLSKYTTVFEYEFTDRNGPPQMTPEPFKLGAVHAGELPYLFPHISHNSRLDGPDLSPESQKLSDVMLRYWGAFMRTGRPQDNGLMDWPSFAQEQFVMDLNPQHLGQRSAYQIHHCDFWNRIYPQYLHH